jgi:uncharacterized protein YndB with AHSA1/START domain
MEPPGEPPRAARALLGARWACALRRAARLATRRGEPVTSENADVVPLRRPPIRQSTLVRSDIAHTFDVFVDTIGTWWPLQPYSIGQDRVREVVFERAQGGRVYEIWADGTDVTWGHLLAWEPPHRFVMTWDALPPGTEVELTFRGLGPALTRVAVEHRGWENLTEEQIAAAAGGYSAGWTAILAAFADRIDT